MSCSVRTGSFGNGGGGETGDFGKLIYTSYTIANEENMIQLNFPTGTLSPYKKHIFQFLRMRDSEAATSTIIYGVGVKSITAEQTTRGVSIITPNLSMPNTIVSFDFSDTFVRFLRTDIGIAFNGRYKVNIYEFIIV